MTPLELYEQFLARLKVIKSGLEHKSKWNQELGETFLDKYIKDYEDKIDEILNNK